MKEHTQLACVGLTSGVVSASGMSLLPLAHLWCPGVVFGIAVIAIFSRYVKKSLPIRFAAIAIIALGYLIAFYVSRGGAPPAWLNLPAAGAVGSLFIVIAVYLNAGRTVDLKSALTLFVVGTTASLFFLLKPLIIVIPTIPLEWPLLLPIPLWQTAVAMTLARPLRNARRIAAERAVPACPSCGYNLTGNISGICPECGNSFS